MLLIITICSFSTLAFLYEISMLLRKLIKTMAEIQKGLTEWRDTEREKRVAIRKDEYRVL